MKVRNILAMSQCRTALSPDLNALKLAQVANYADASQCRTALSPDLNRHVTRENSRLHRLNAERHYPLI